MPELTPRRARLRSNILSGSLQVGALAVSQTKGTVSIPSRFYFGTIRYVGPATQSPTDDTLVVCLEIELERKTTARDSWFSSTIFGVQHCLAVSRSLFFAGQAVHPMALGSLKALPAEVLRVVAEFTAKNKNEMKEDGLVSRFAFRYGFLRPVNHRRVTARDAVEKQEEGEQYACEVNSRNLADPLIRLVGVNLEDPSSYSSPTSQKNDDKYQQVVSLPGPPSSAWCEFMQRCMNGANMDPTQLLSLLKKFTEFDFFHREDTLGLSALSAALLCDNPDLEVVRLLVSGGSLLVSEQTATSPLHIACAANQKEICDLIVGNNSALYFYPGPEGNNKMKGVFAPVDAALRKHHFDLVLSIFSLNPQFYRYYEERLRGCKLHPLSDPSRWKNVLMDPDSLWMQGNLGTLLHLSAGEQGDNAHLFQELLSVAPAPILLKRNYLGRTCLHVAVSANNFEVASLLVKKCAKIATIADTNGFVPFQVALTRKKSKFISLLQEVFVTAKDHYDVMGVFATACAAQQSSLAMDLLPSSLTDDDVTPEAIVAVSRCKNQSLVEAFFLKFSSAATMLLEEPSYYPLDHAVVCGHNEIALYLLDRFGFHEKDKVGPSRILSHCLRHNNTTLFEAVLQRRERNICVEDSFFMWSGNEQKGVYFVTNPGWMIDPRRSHVSSHFPAFCQYMDKENTSIQLDTILPVIQHYRNHEKALVTFILPFLKRMFSSTQVIFAIFCAIHAHCSPKSQAPFLKELFPHYLAEVKEPSEFQLLSAVSKVCRFTLSSIPVDKDYQRFFEFVLQSEPHEGNEVIVLAILAWDFTFYRQVQPTVKRIVNSDTYKMDAIVNACLSLSGVPPDAEFESGRISSAELIEWIGDVCILRQYNSVRSKAKEYIRMLGTAIAQGSSAKNALFYIIRLLSESTDKTHLSDELVAMCPPPLSRKVRSTIPISTGEIVWQTLKGIPHRSRALSLAGAVVTSLVVKQASDADVLFFLKIMPSVANIAFQEAAVIPRLSLVQAIQSAYTVDFFPCSNEVAELQLQQHIGKCVWPAEDELLGPMNLSVMALCNLRHETLEKAHQKFPAVMKGISPKSLYWGMGGYPRSLKIDRENVSSLARPMLRLLNPMDLELGTMPKTWPLVRFQPLFKLPEKTFLALMDWNPECFNGSLKEGNFTGFLLPRFVALKYWLVVGRLLETMKGSDADKGGYISSGGSSKYKKRKSKSRLCKSGSITEVEWNVRFGRVVMQAGPVDVLSVCCRKFGVISHGTIGQQLFLRRDLSEADKQQAFKALASVLQPGENRFQLLLFAIKHCEDEKAIDAWKEISNITDAYLKDRAKELAVAVCIGGKYSWFCKYASHTLEDGHFAEQLFFKVCTAKHRLMAVALVKDYPAVFHPILFQGKGAQLDDIFCTCAAGGVEEIFSTISTGISDSQFFLVLGFALKHQQVHLLPIFSKVLVDRFGDSSQLPLEDETAQRIDSFIDVYFSSSGWVERGMEQAINAYCCLKDIVDKKSGFHQKHLTFEPILKKALHKWCDVIQSKADLREKFESHVTADGSAIKFLSCMAPRQEIVASFLLEVCSKPNGETVFQQAVEAAVLHPIWLRKLLQNIPCRTQPLSQASYMQRTWQTVLDTILNTGDTESFELFANNVLAQTSLLLQGGFSLPHLVQQFASINAKSGGGMLEAVNTTEEVEGSTSARYYRVSPSQWIQLQSLRHVIPPGGKDLHSKATAAEISTHFSVMLFSNQCPGNNCEVAKELARMSDEQFTIKLDETLLNLTHQQICDLSIPEPILSFFDRLMAYFRSGLVEPKKKEEKGKRRIPSTKPGQVQCPICQKYFATDAIKRHASGCNNFVDPEPVRQPVEEPLKKDEKQTEQKKKRLNQRWANFEAISKFVDDKVNACRHITIQLGEGHSLLKWDEKRGLVLSVVPSSPSDATESVSTMLPNLMHIHYQLQEIEHQLLAKLPIHVLFRQFIGEEGKKYVAKQFSNMTELEVKNAIKSVFSREGYTGCDLSPVSTLNFSSGLFQELIQRDSTYTLLRAALAVAIRYHRPTESAMLVDNVFTVYDGELWNQLRESKFQSGLIKETAEFLDDWAESYRNPVLSEKDLTAHFKLCSRLPRHIYQHLHGKKQKTPSYHGMQRRHRPKGKKPEEEKIVPVEYKYAKLNSPEFHVTLTLQTDGKQVSSPSDAEVNIVVEIPKTLAEAQQCLEDLQMCRFEKVAAQYFPSCAQMIKVVDPIMVRGGVDEHLDGENSSDDEEEEETDEEE